MLTCVCIVYSNSCNHVPRVAQRYRTIAAHTRRVHPHCVCSVLHAHAQFCRFDKAVAPRHSVTLQSLTATLIPLFSSSELTGCRYPGLLDRKNLRTCAPRGSQTLDFLRARRAHYPLGQALRSMQTCQRYCHT